MSTLTSLTPNETAGQVSLLGRLSGVFAAYFFAGVGA